MQNEFSSYLEKIEEKIRASLPEKEDFDWQKKSFGNLDCVNFSHLKELIEPNKNLIALGGKRWRPLLLVLCAKAINEQNEECFDLAPVVEFIHTASLIQDDIEDSSTERRGKPCAHLVYGQDKAINASSWLYFEAATAIENLKCPDELKNKILKIYLEEIRRLHLGQAMDIMWHADENLFPSQDEYLQMVRCKTGTLSSLSAKLGAVCANADEKIVDEAGRIASLIGAGFQIIDDVINLKTGNPGKIRGDDIVEGKKSLPVILFVEKCAQENHLEKIEALKNFFVRAKKEGIKSSAVTDAVSLLEDSGAAALAKERGISYIKQGCREFENLFGKNEFTDLIGRLFFKMIPENL